MDGAMFTPDAPQLTELVHAPVAFTPFDVKWVPVSARFAVLGTKPNDSGIVQVYELAAGQGLEPSPIQSVPLPHGLKCGTFDGSALADRHLAVGDNHGGLTVVNLEAPGKPVYSAPRAHGGADVIAIDGVGGAVGRGAPELATAGRDGRVCVWDTRVQEPVVTLTPVQGVNDRRPREAWAVAFGHAHSDTDRVVAAGYDNGDVKLFDLRTGRMRWEGAVCPATAPSPTPASSAPGAAPGTSGNAASGSSGGVVCLQFDRKDIEMNKLVATALDGRFSVLDVRTQHPASGFARVTERAHKSTVWTVRHSPHNRDVWATTGGNGGVNLYRYRYPDKRSVKDEGGDGAPRGVPGRVELLNARVVSSQPLVGWDWCAEREGLAAAVALDQSVRVYAVSRLERHR